MKEWKAGQNVQNTSLKPSTTQNRSERDYIMLNCYELAGLDHTLEMLGKCWSVLTDFSLVFLNLLLLFSW